MMRREHLGMILQVLQLMSPVLSQQEGLEKRCWKLFFSLAGREVVAQGAFEPLIESVSAAKKANKPANLNDSVIHSDYL